VATAAAVALSQSNTVSEPLSLEAAWALLGMRFHAPQRLLPWPVVHELTAGLKSTPGEALIALAGSNLASADAVRALIQAQVPWQPVDRTPAISDNQLVGVLRRSPLSGALLAIPLLAREGGPESLPRTWVECTAQFGHTFSLILTGQVDPAMNQGGMKEGKVLANMPEEFRGPLLATFRCVPKALLDGDARRLAAVNLFDNRHHEAFVRAGRDAREHIETAHRLCEDWGLADGRSLLTHRDDPDGKGGWVALSAASAALALIARLGARGDDRAGDYLDARWGSWVELARRAPDHVTLDLILAEAMVAAHTAEVLPTIRSDEGDLDDSAA
jgi:hypothetical protein